MVKSHWLVVSMVAALTVAAPLNAPNHSAFAAAEEEGEPSGEGCGKLWDFSKNALKSHSSRTSRLGWEPVDEHYDMAHSHTAWGGKHTLEIAAHVSCGS